MRPITGVIAGITLVITLTAVLSATPTSAQEPSLPDLPVDLPVKVPAVEGLPELPVPALPGLDGILECITGGVGGATSPSALTGVVQCLLEQLLDLISSLLGGLGTDLPVGAPALP